VVWKSSSTGERSHRSRGCHVHHGGGSCLESSQFSPSSVAVAAWYSTIIVRSVAVASAWSDNSMQRQYLQRRHSAATSLADEMVVAQGLD
jgi:hypothetical protein